MTRDLAILAGRVEGLSGPDRHLGREILLACGFGYVSPLNHWRDPTASLDAAMSLMPEGWILRLSQIRFGLWRVELWRGDKSFNAPADVSVIAATPALALTAAALRARSHTKDTDDVEK